MGLFIENKTGWWIRNTATYNLSTDKEVKVEKNIDADVSSTYLDCYNKR